MRLEDSLNDFLRDVRTLAIICTQFGDSGKGKVSDLIAAFWADIVIRGTGGGNAGHTVYIDGKPFVLHTVPCGITRDREGVINVIGNGVVLDPSALCGELDGLDKQGMSYNNLLIAYNAHLILPQHILLDRLKDTGKGIGTTGRGIGPTYTDHTARCGLIVNDLFNPDIFKEKFKKNLDKMNLALLAKYSPDAIQEIAIKLGMQNLIKDGVIQVDAVIEAYRKYGERIKEMVRDTDEFVRSRVGLERIALEGAQGHLLSINYGTYPYVTSSDCSVQGLANGSGLSEKAVDKVLAVVKFPYMTRVGNGPFPTEFGGKKSEEHCGSHLREEEEREFPDVDINDSDEFRQGIAVRRVGGEFGATTGRPRRTGWLDLVLLKYAMNINGTDLVLTKLQVMDTCREIKICTHYVYDGPDYFYDGEFIRKGDRVDKVIPYAEFLKHCRPIYTCLPGWMTSTIDINDYHDAPREMKHVVEFVERRIKGRARILSMGPERHQTIVRN